MADNGDFSFANGGAAQSAVGRNGLARIQTQKRGENGICHDDSTPPVKAQTLHELHSLQKKRSNPTTPIKGAQAPSLLPSSQNARSNSSSPSVLIIEMTTQRTLLFLILVHPHRVRRASYDWSIDLNPEGALQADGQVEVAGTSPSPTTEVDVELGEGGIRSGQAAPSTSAPRSDVEAESGQERGVTTSRISIPKLTAVIGIGLINTSVFPANTLPYSICMILAALAVASSLFLCHAGDRMPTKVQQALLLVFTMAVLGALSMLGVGVSLQG